MHKDQSETYMTTINKIEEKGSGHTYVWRDIGNVNPRKLKITVPQTLPGEKVKLTVKHPNVRRTTVFADEIIEKSPERVTPRCQHFERCGGCVWQHWDYNGQLNEKTKMVKEALEAEGLDPSSVLDMVGMEEPWHYRNKMEFTFTKDGSLGLHEIGNYRKVIPIETCFIAAEDMAQVAVKVSDWAKIHQLPGYVKDTKRGLLRHLLIRKSFATGEMMVGLVATKSPAAIDETALEALIDMIEQSFPQAKSLLWLENNDWADLVQAEQVHFLAGRDFIYDELLRFSYRLWYDTFFQTNPPQAERLVELAIEMAKPQANEKMIDLFCGVGTFSLPFASRVRHLAGVEIVESSIESAKRNAKENGLENTYFLAKDARRGIDDVLEQFGTPDLLLLDPPRSGAGGKVMRRIGRAEPKRVVYVSCNPLTFATDVKELVAFGYELVQVQPVDLFPHTNHVECIALIQRETM